MLGSLLLLASLCTKRGRPPHAAGLHRPTDQSRLVMQAADLSRQRHLRRAGGCSREEQHQGR